MGKVSVRGKSCREFLQQLTTNDVGSLVDNQVQYSLFCSPDGGIIDDLTIYNLGESYLCVINASNTARDIEWMRSQGDEGVEIVDESVDTALLSLQGPHAAVILQELLNTDLGSLEYMHCSHEKAGTICVLASRTGYTGEDGFELFLKKEDAPFFWDELIRCGAKHDLVLAGLGARDILRVEAGYSLYGNELDETIDPFEASLGWVVRLNKDFIGKQSLLAKKENLSRKRIGFIMEERAFARAGYDIYSQENERIGKVTSGVFSPHLNSFIGMGYADFEYAQESTSFIVKIRDRSYRGRVRKLPFVERKTYKGV